MACRCLSRLEVCRKAVSVPSSLSSRWSYQPHSSVILTLCNKPRSTALNAVNCRYSSYIVKSPFKDIEIPNKLLQELIWEVVDQFPESRAVKCGLTGRAYSFADLQRLSCRFAESLRRAGFKRGEVLAMVLPNCPEFTIIVLGALEAELVVSFINHSYTADEMCHQLKDSGSVCVVAAPDKLDVVLSAVSKVEHATQSKPFRGIVAVDVLLPGAALRTGIGRFSEMVADSSSQSVQGSYTTKSTELAVLPYSSGTTGLSKGVCLSHRNLTANLRQIYGIEGMGINSPAQGQDVALGLLPFYHIYGFVCILLGSLASGAQVITLPKFEQDSFIKALENDEMSVLLLVPPLVLFMGSSDRLQSRHLSHTRMILSGAAPLGATDMEQVKAKLTHDDCIISQAYGMTELSPVATVPVRPAKDLATVGAPVPNTFGRIIDPTTGQPLGPNQNGELCFKGPQVMLGYHKNPKATAEMIDAEGWLRTGDIGYYDEDSHFYVQDRLKELIKVKGLQVPPAELEEVLRTHPFVSDAGVIGVPNERTGEVPVAFIVCKKDCKLRAEQVKQFLSEKVSRHKQVGEVIFMDSIPKSAAGKILRKDLRQIYKDTH